MQKTVAFALFKYFPHGGLQRDFLRIAQGCQARGCAVRVYTMEWVGPIPEGFEVCILPIRKMSNHGRVLGFAADLKNRLRAEPADLVVGFNKIPGLDVYFAGDSCFAERTIGRSIFYRVTSHCRVYQQMESVVFGPEAKTQILLISPRQVEEFQKHYKTPDSRLTLLPPGLEDDFNTPDDREGVRKRIRAEFGLGERDYLLLQVGSSFKTKGVDRAVEAVAALPHDLRKRCTYLVVGEGRKRPYRRLAGKRGIADRLRFAGVRGDIPEIMASADLLLHPARAEAAGKTLVEGLASELPILCSGICGYAPYIREAEGGIVLSEPYDQTELNVKLQEILNNDRLSQYRANIKSYCEHHPLTGLAEQAVECILRQVS